jgi:hypothetical protein
MQPRHSVAFSWDPVDEKAYHNFRDIALLPYLVSKGLVAGLWSARSHLIALSHDSRCLLSFDAVSSSPKPIVEKDFESAASFFGSGSLQSAHPSGALACQLDSQIIHLSSYNGTFISFWAKCPLS